MLIVLEDPKADRALRRFHVYEGKKEIEFDPGPYVGSYDGPKGLLHVFHG